ncbi:response regulator [Paraburkholderia terrae]|uniref:response regulator n=1 Tax=Paraburkholderia terrae TaxID=311230 RepID=UPI00296AF1EF|nr:response regulator [Paraburkholderia terrae]MDW3656495.1 response regulator [Paraburkholderia terrae]
MSNLIMATILLIDDDYEALWPLQLALEADGNHVVLAENGQIGLTHAARYQPDMIVTDWNMPVMDGLEFASRVRCSPALRHIPILMASGDRPSDELLCHFAGFVPKPVSIAGIGRMAMRYVARRISGRHVGTLTDWLRPARRPGIDARCWP